MQNKVITIWDCVLSPWNGKLQNSSACAWQCTSFWQLACIGDGTLAELEFPKHVHSM